MSDEWLPVFEMLSVCWQPNVLIKEVKTGLNLRVAISIFCVKIQRGVLLFHSWGQGVIIGPKNENIEKWSLFRSISESCNLFCLWHASLVSDVCWGCLPPCLGSLLLKEWKQDACRAEPCSWSRLPAWGHIALSSAGFFPLSNLCTVVFSLLWHCRYYIKMKHIFSGLLPPIKTDSWELMILRVLTACCWYSLRRPWESITLEGISLGLSCIPWILFSLIFLKKPGPDMCPSWSVL